MSRGDKHRCLTGRERTKHARFFRTRTSRDVSSEHFDFEYNRDDRGPATLTSNGTSSTAEASVDDAYVARSTCRALTSPAARSRARLSRTILHGHEWYRRHRRRGYSHPRIFPAPSFYAPFTATTPRRPAHRPTGIAGMRTARARAHLDSSRIHPRGTSCVSTVAAHKYRVTVCPPAVFISSHDFHPDWKRTESLELVFSATRQGTHLLRRRRRAGSSLHQRDRRRRRLVAKASASPSYRKNRDECEDK